MKYQKILILIALALILYSCPEKDNEIVCLDPILLEYVDFKVGSWWVYDTYINDTIIYERDSIYITKREKTIETHSRENPVRDYETLRLSFQGTMGNFYGISEDIYYFENVPNHLKLRGASITYDSKKQQLSNDSLNIGGITFYNVIELQTQPTYDFYYYYSKNIGVIQDIRYYPDSTVKKNLVKYNIIQ